MVSVPCTLYFHLYLRNSCHPHLLLAGLLSDSNSSNISIPFFVLSRWKPGPKARYKCTVVCQQCARLKNVCQTCLFDLEYGLPVQVS